MLVVLIEGTCTFRSGGILGRRVCGADPTGQCVYCAESFCDTHGDHGEDYYEVCHRQKCAAKWNDLKQHKEWVARHYHHNLAGSCAAEGCDEALDISCERCKLRFCQPHVRATTVQELDFQGQEVVHLMLLCEHCADRRKVWE